MESCATDNFPPNYSFAVGPIQIEDKRLYPNGWERTDFDDKLWENAIISRPRFRKLYPRQIPQMTNTSIYPEKIVSISKSIDSEKFISFRIVQSLKKAEELIYPDAISFARTFIFSPDEQELEFGTWWGEFFLNSKPVEKIQSSSGNRPLMERRKFYLQKGWNELFIYYKMTYGTWDFCISYPADAGIYFSAEKRKNSKFNFMIAGPFSKHRGEKIVSQKPWNNFEQIKMLSSSLVKIQAQNILISPIKNLAWFNGKKCDLRCNIRDINLPSDRRYSVVFDFGKIVLGRIKFDYVAPQGTVIDFGWAEEKLANKPNYGKNFLVQAGEREITAGGEGHCETFFPRGFRYLEILVHSSKKGSVQIKNLCVNEELYPLSKDGYFRCSDPELNKLWDYGWNTLRLCTEDVFTDCPWRERTLYAGDLLPETATNAVSCADLRLVRRSLQILCQSQNEDGFLQSRAPNPRNEPTLYDYPIITIINTDWYCRLTKDAKFAKTVYPIFSKLLRKVLSYKNKNGLYYTPYPVFVEHGYAEKTGTVCTSNALVVEALRSWSRLLSMIEKDNDAKKAEREAEKLEAAVLDLFWNSDTECFSDKILDDGSLKIESFNAAANTWVLLFCKNIPQYKIDGAIKKITEIVDSFSPEKESRTISPYGAFYLFGALYKHGLAGKAEKYMKLIYKDMLRNPSGTIWEHANPSKSLVHAWSTAANYYLSTRALGIRMGFPETDRFDEIIIAPQTENLSWAEGVVPHPLGKIKVRWEMKNGKMSIQYSAPQNVKVKIQKPCSIALIIDDFAK